jgi:CRISPR/Cas system-associated exonuclease Cas4 (RecB family)
MSDKWTNASELSEYLYCRRAWWFKQVRGRQGANIHQMESGSRFHQQHGRRVRHLPLVRGLAYLLIFVAVALAVFQYLVGG